MKRCKLLLCALLMLSAVGCTKNETKNDTPVETIHIHMTIVDTVSGTELFDDEISAEGTELTLADVLSANAEKLQLVSEDSAYGMQINGLMGVETENWSSGPWWMYTSENNESCLNAGYCTGASELPVADGDKFEFTFSTGY